MKLENIRDEEALEIIKKLERLNKERNNLPRIGGW